MSDLNNCNKSEIITIALQLQRNIYKNLRMEISIVYICKYTYNIVASKMIGGFCNERYKKYANR